jgi:hypothetical protein
MPKDNGSGIAKQRLRAEMCRDLPADAQILEMFSGEGYLYRSIWHRWRGVTIDLDIDKARQAAKERPRWACYRADSLRAVRGGLAAEIPFAIVDIDAYGAPWKFLRAWMLSERVRAPRTLLFLTDGWSHHAINVDRTLFEDFYEGQVTTEMVREQVPRKLAEWGREHRVLAKIIRTVQTRTRDSGRQMLLHVVEATC